MQIVYRNYVDVSVAVSSPRGLVVPVLRNVEAMSLANIESGLAELASKAREDKIGIEDMTGGTFTVSNGGVFGSLMGTPIINQPQSAILGMHATKQRAVVINVRTAIQCPVSLIHTTKFLLAYSHRFIGPLPLQGKVEVRPVMYLALTYDHRLIDGREAVTFLVGVRDKIEDPRRLLLGL
jgi:2-oxoglutarate dehydrogenase E2 component (dihydrolipoamide succinyltransferase)